MKLTECKTNFWIRNQTNVKDITKRLNNLNLKCIKLDDNIDEEIKRLYGEEKQENGEMANLEVDGKMTLSKTKDLFEREGKKPGREETH